jgi:CTP synthase (UTP-ammonia lyase)
MHYKSRIRQENPDTGLVEIVEIEDHPFFIGVQYHPEYKSTVANPHPIFCECSCCRKSKKEIISVHQRYE